MTSLATIDLTERRGSTFPTSRANTVSPVPGSLREALLQALAREEQREAQEIEAARILHVALNKKTTVKDFARLLPGINLNELMRNLVRAGHFIVVKGKYRVSPEARGHPDARTARCPPQARGKQRSFSSKQGHY